MTPGGRWWIGLDTWVLQDGNYTDFVTRERRQFALEFGYSRSKRLRSSPDAGPPRCTYSGRDATYEIHGRLLRRSESFGPTDAFVLDVGLQAYSHQLVLDDIEPPAAGDWLDGEIHLAVDHFAYMDELARLSGMPPLIYTWTIDEIQVRTTSEDPWRTVERTRTWDLDGSYLLRCTLESDGPVQP